MVFKVFHMLSQHILLQNKIHFNIHKMFYLRLTKISLEIFELQKGRSYFQESTFIKFQTLKFFDIFLIKNYQRDHLCIRISKLFSVQFDSNSQKYL